MKLLAGWMSTKMRERYFDIRDEAKREALKKLTGRRTRYGSPRFSSPPISGYFASRPNLIGDPGRGQHRVDSWINASNFQRLNPHTQAGQFGNSGRNVARGPSFTNVDASALKNFPIHEAAYIQFRAEMFNIANHPNFGVPVADLASPNFGRVLQAGSPRLTQFALKIVF